MTYVQVPDLFFRFNPKDGKEKITFGPIDAQKHLTIHLGTKSGVLDIHTKNEATGEYNTLFQIDHLKFIQIAENISNKLESYNLKDFYFSASSSKNFPANISK